MDDPPPDTERGKDREFRAMWAEAIWGLGLIGSVLAIVAVVIALAP